MSDCSAKTESEGDETDADASVTCTAEGSGRRGEAFTETGDTGACTPADPTPGHDLEAWEWLLGERRRPQSQAEDLESHTGVPQEPHTSESPDQPQINARRASGFIDELKNDEARRSTVYEPAEQVPTPLGKRGSRAKIDYSAKTCIANTYTFANSTCRDKESGCSVESTTEKEMDADASILSVARDETEGCLRGPKNDEDRRTQTLGRAHTQNIYIERWDGVRAWQTVYRRTYTFAENSEWIDVDTYDVRRRPTANREGQQTRMFDESPYENENVLRVCPSTAYREITGSRDTRYVGLLHPVGEGRANMLIVESRDNPGAKRHRDDERRRPEGSAEQERTNVFVDEPRKSSQKRTRGDPADHRHRAERSARVVEMEKGEPCSVTSRYDVSSERGGSQTTDTRRLYKGKVSRHGAMHATSPRMCERGDKPVSQLQTRSKTRNEIRSGPQTAETFHRSRSNTELPALLNGELRQGLEGSINARCSSSNVVVLDEERGSETASMRRLQLEGNEYRRLLTKRNGEQWTTHPTSSQMNDEGNEPVSLVPTRSKTRNEIRSGPQTAETLHQSRSIPEKGTLLHGELKRSLGEAINAKRSKSNVTSWYGMTKPSFGQQRWVGYQYPPETAPKAPDKRRTSLERAIHTRHSKSNEVGQCETTEPSLGQQERVGYKYPPVTAPRAPDKQACRIYDRQDVEVHNAPRTTEVDGVKHHPSHKRDAFQRQQSPCDSRHESRDETRERVRERGKTDTQHVRGLYCYQDNDDSWSSESEVANGDDGTRYDVPDDKYEHSECSDESANTSNDAHESGMCPDSHIETSSDVDDEPDGSDNASVMDEPTNNDIISSEDAVEFGCIQVYHHVAVDDDDEMESDDGQEPSRDGHESESGYGDEPYPNGLYYDEDGHRWTYDVYTSECNDPSNCGSPVEQHWMDMGEEPPPWLEEEDASDNYEEEDASDNCEEEEFSNDNEEDDVSDEEEYDDDESSYE
jgi:hypothetical protein